MTGLELAGLTCAVYVTATLSAVVGMAGGMTLLVVMLQVLDPLVVLPLHGAVQLVSNSSRTLVQREHVEWGVAARFALLLLPAGALGLALAHALPRGLLRGAIGALVLVFTLQLWRRVSRSSPRPKPAPVKPALVPVPAVSSRVPVLAGASLSPLGEGRTPRTWQEPLPDPDPVPAPAPEASSPQVSPYRFVLLGGVAGTLNTSVGATGPLIAPFFVDLGLERRGVIGTKAACQSLGHFAKLLVFGLAGFAFAPYLPALGLFALAAVAGTWTGSRLLERLSEGWFTRLYLSVLFLLGARLLLQEVLG